MDIEKYPKEIFNSRISKHEFLVSFGKPLIKHTERSFITQDGKFTARQLSSSEKKLFVKNHKAYFRHVAFFIRSSLIPIYGLVRVKVGHGKTKHFVIESFKEIESNDVHLINVMPTTWCGNLERNQLLDLEKDVEFLKSINTTDYKIFFLHDAFVVCDMKTFKLWKYFLTKLQKMLGMVR